MRMNDFFPMVIKSDFSIQANENTEALSYKNIISDLEEMNKLPR